MKPLKSTETEVSLDSINNMSPKEAYDHACDVIGGRWLQGEHIIVKDSECAYKYAADIIKGRWPEGEQAIAKDPNWAYCYALNIVMGRFAEGESIIAESTDWSCNYAFYIIDGRFTEAEPLIAKSVVWADWYAYEIIKDRWPEGEEAIAASQHVDLYLKRFFPNQKVTTKAELGEYEWSRLGLEGYFVNEELLKRPMSLLDMVIQ